MKWTMPSWWIDPQNTSDSAAANDYRCLLSAPWLQGVQRDGKLH